MMDYSFWFYGFSLFGIILIRYFCLAGGLYWCFYSPISPAFVTHNQSSPTCNLSVNPPQQDHTPTWQSMQQDIHLSVISAGIFALAAAFILSGYGWGMTRLYSYVQLDQLWYVGISYLLVLVLQDTYFYFTHRLCHHPSLFPWFHQGHHRSRYPTPWTSFAFDPLEAIVQSIFLAGIVFVLPLHFVTLIAVLMTMSIWAVINHLGIEHLPASFPHAWLEKWFIGPCHHSVHHRKYNVHYGLYFTFWDNVMGTQVK